MLKQYKTITSVGGPLLIVQGVKDVKYEEMVEIELGDGSKRRGRVLEVSDTAAVVQLFEDTRGVALDNSKATFLGKTLRIGVSQDMLGRVFDGAAKPKDGLSEIIPEKLLDINGAPINPYAREYPNDFIQTGISTIDGLNTLARGQKLPIFSCAGLPHSKLVAQIVRQAQVLGKSGEDSASGAKDSKFAVVFGAMGITFEESEFFINLFKETGSLERAVLYINLADDPVIERITLPKMALTTAEYLAFEKDMHVLAILTDMTNYAEALREISAARKEIPGRRGYGGYLYTDLSAIYERAGRIKGKAGSITQIPVLTMPEDDRTHPIPDLTSYITEGQIILSRKLHQKGIYPPIDVLPSLSHLKDKLIGRGITREDHHGLLNQLYAAYARGKEAKERAVILGETALTQTEKKFSEFADEFERRFIQQGYDENRSLEETLNIGWELMSVF